MVKSLVQRIFRFDDVPTAQSNSDVKRVQIIHSTPLGSYGSESYAGYPSEDYLQQMRGTQRADLFDKMRRSDPQVRMCLSAVKAPIKSSLWEVVPDEGMGDEGKRDAELIDHILFHGMDETWSQFVSEAFTFMDFGHSVFELVDRVVFDHKKFGTFNSIRELSFRSQRTLERWNLNPQTQKLASISQYAYGDLQRLVDIPAEFLVLFSLEREGSNYEGISALRAIYGNWFRKNHYQKLNAIGVEKHAIPTPIVEVPEGKESGVEYDNLILALQRYMVHEKNYLTIPAGYKVTMNNNVYDPQKVETSIDNEDKRMVKAFMANFLELGMNGFGSQSLSFDLSDFFLGSIDHIATQFTDVINQRVIPRMIQLNRGPREAYPKLKHSGITDKAGKEIADIAKLLVDAGVLTADDVLESHLRKRFGLPAMDLATKRAKAAPAPGAGFAASPSLIERVKAMRLRHG